MTRKEFKTALFSYCESLGFIIGENTVRLNDFNCIFYMLCIPNFDDNTLHYTPLPKEHVTTMRKIKIQYNNSTLDLYKHIAKKWRKFEIASKGKQKLEKIEKDFE